MAVLDLGFCLVQRGQESYLIGQVAVIDIWTEERLKTEVRDIFLRAQS